MREYTPHLWCIVEFDSPYGKVQKVLASYYGGFAYGDSWKLSSGITSVTETDDAYHITNESGSIYHCGKQCEGTSGYTRSIYDGWMTEIESTDGLSLTTLDSHTYLKEKLHVTE